MTRPVNQQIEALKLPVQHKINLLEAERFNKFQNVYRSLNKSNITQSDIF
jgi:hypothetical protein